jgi:hypothetical protein
MTLACRIAAQQRDSSPATNCELAVCHYTVLLVAASDVMTHMYIANMRGATQCISSGPADSACTCMQHFKPAAPVVHDYCFASYQLGDLLLLRGHIVFSCIIARGMTQTLAAFLQTLQFETPCCASS